MMHLVEHLVNTPDLTVRKEFKRDDNGNDLLEVVLEVWGCPVAMFFIYRTRGTSVCLYPTYIWITNNKDLVRSSQGYTLKLLNDAYNGILEDLTNSAS